MNQSALRSPVRTGRKTKERSVCLIFTGEAGEGCNLIGLHVRVTGRLLGNWCKQLRCRCLNSLISPGALVESWLRVSLYTCRGHVRLGKTCTLIYRQGLHRNVTREDTHVRPGEIITGRGFGTTRESDWSVHRRNHFTQRHAISVAQRCRLVLFSGIWFFLVTPLHCPDFSLLPFFNTSSLLSWYVCLFSILQSVFGTEDGYGSGVFF